MEISIQQLIDDSSSIKGKVYAPLNKQVSRICFVNKYQKDAEIATIEFVDGSFTTCSLNDAIVIENDSCRRIS